MPHCTASPPPPPPPPPNSFRPSSCANDWFGSLCVSDLYSTHKKAVFTASPISRKASVIIFLRTKKAVFTASPISRKASVIIFLRTKKAVFTASPISRKASVIIFVFDSFVVAFLLSQLVSGPSSKTRFYRQKRPKNMKFFRPDFLGKFNSKQEPLSNRS